MQRTPVKSSNIVSVGYDPSTWVLEIEFGNATYQYAWVSPVLFALFMAAESKGNFLHERIKPNCSVRKLPPELGAAALLKGVPKDPLETAEPDTDTPIGLAELAERTPQEVSK